MTDDSANVRRPSVATVLLWCTILLGFALRFVRLEFKGLWIDEVDWLDSTMVPTLAEAVKAGNFPHTPFFAVVMWPFQSLFINDFLTRAIPATLGALTVPLVYAIGARLFSRGAGVAAALVLALCPIHIDYSRQFEPYAPAVFLLTATVLCLLRAHDTQRLRLWIYAAILAGVSAYASVFSLCVLGLISGVLALHSFVIRTPLRTLVPWAAFWVATLALYVPYFVYSFFFRERVHGLGTTDQFDATFPDTYSSLENMQLLFAGIWRDDAIELTVPLLLLAAILSLGMLRWVRSRPLGTTVVSAWAFVVLVIFCICYLQRYQTTGRYFLTTIPGLCLFFGASIHGLLFFPARRKPIRIAVAALAIVLLLPVAYWSIGAIAAYYVSPPVEDNKYLLKAIEAAARPEDKVFLSIANPPLLVERYAPRLTPQMQTVQLGEFPAYVADAATATRVWFAYRTPRPKGIDQLVRARGLHLYEFHVRGQNTAVLLLWPPKTTPTAILADTIQTLEVAAHYAGPNKPELQLALEEQSRHVAISRRKEPAFYLQPALEPLHARCIASPTDHAAFALLGEVSAKLGDSRGAAKAFATALLVQEGSQPDIQTASGLFGALRGDAATPHPLLARYAMRRVSTLPVVVNGSFEEKDATGRPLGWIVSPPNAIVDSTTSAVQPFDGKQHMTLQTLETHWVVLGFPLKLNPDAMAGNRLVANAVGQAPGDTLFMQIEAKVDGKDAVLARSAFPASTGAWTPLTLEIDDFPLAEAGTVQIRFALRNTPGRICHVDNVNATLQLSDRARSR